MVNDEPDEFDRKHVEETTRSLLHNCGWSVYSPPLSRRARVHDLCGPDDCGP